MGILEFIKTTKAKYNSLSKKNTDAIYFLKDSKELMIEENCYSPSPPDQLWVKIDGDDSNNGSSSSPLRTIMAAINRCNKYTTINVGPGTYSENTVMYGKSIRIVGGTPPPVIHPLNSLSIYNGYLNIYRITISGYSGNNNNILTADNSSLKVSSCLIENRWSAYPDGYGISANNGSKVYCYEVEINSVSCAIKAINNSDVVVYNGISNNINSRKAFQATFNSRIITDGKDTYTKTVNSTTDDSSYISHRDPVVTYIAGMSGASAKAPLTISRLPNNSIHIMGGISILKDPVKGIHFLSVDWKCDVITNSLYCACDDGLFVTLKVTTDGFSIYVWDSPSSTLNPPYHLYLNHIIKTVN